MNGALHSEHVISRSGIAVSPESENEDDHSLLFGALASRFFQPQDVARKRCFINARRKPVPTVTCWECTPAIHSIQFFCENFLTKSVAQDLHGPRFSVAHTQHTPHANCRFSPGTCVARDFPKHEQTIS